MSRVKIIFLSANPRDRDHLRLRHEYDVIKSNIENSPNKDLLELIPVWDVQPNDIMNCLLEHKPYIVHFVGHGDNNAIVFLNDNGDARSVPSGVLARLFRKLAGNTRVVILNACCTSAQAEEIAQGVGCAIGITHDISDTAAILFAASFYKMIAFGQSVRNAFDVSVLNLQLNERTEEANLPVLLLGNNINPDTLIPVQQLYIGHWFLSHPSLWNNYLTLISFTKNVHHAFQTLDIQHINDLTRRLDELPKKHVTPPLAEIDSIQRLWDNYACAYSEFQKSLPDASTQNATDAFSILQAVDNQTARQALSEAYRHYQVITTGLSTYSNTHDRASRLISGAGLFVTLKTPQDKTEFHSNFYGLLSISRQLVVNADNLLKKLIEATEVGKVV